MSNSELDFDLIAQRAARKCLLEKAREHRRAIVKNEDGLWLIGAVKNTRTRSATARLGTARRFEFLGNNPEQIVSQWETESGYEAFDMPASSVIRRIDGSGYSNWVYTVDNNMFGDEYLRIELAYRKVGRENVLVLRSARQGERVYAGQSVGYRVRGHGPDRSL